MKQYKHFFCFVESWKGKSPMDKPHNEPYTINTGIMSSQHNVAKGVWQSYFSEEKVLLLSPETSEQPTYHDALRETYPSRPKTTLAECLANEKKSLSAEYPFASRRGSIYIYMYILYFTHVSYFSFRRANKVSTL